MDADLLLKMAIMTTAKDACELLMALRPGAAPAEQTKIDEMIMRLANMARSVA